MLSFRLDASAEGKLLPPREGVYHAAHPDFGLRGDRVTRARVRAFVELAGRDIVWSFVAFHWDRGIVFPVEACRTLHKENVVPLVGIMPWSSLEQGKPEEVYTLSRIAAGEFDDDLARCARDVRSLGFPVMIEFGPEANGKWFPWSGFWNGGASDHSGERGVPDGPERFRDAYRHVVDLFRENGADNVTWVFHIASVPGEAWNAASCYYPGDAWVDWIGASVYGRLRGDAPAKPFDDIMKKVYPGLAALSEKKPVALLEMGVSEAHPPGDKADWMREALSSIASGRYPRLKAVGWWNKRLRADGSRSYLEIDSSPESLAAYRDGVARFVDRPLWGSD